ncbi:MAG: endonuclease III domain-containing protein [Spirochaetota bacterium]
MKIYGSLFKLYGPQGWWPLLCLSKSDKNEQNNFSKGYHSGDYSYPKNNSQRFEICAGAILTQNTAWLNVEKALINLYKQDLLNAKSISNINIEKLKEHIRPAGYYNQKAVYLKELAVFYLSLKGKTPSRDLLLSVKGIGPETADSMLLYAFNQPEFVVDAYTKRMFSHLGFFDKNAKYNEIKEMFEKNLPKETILYQEYHALIVQHAKNNYSRKVKSAS